MVVCSTIYASMLLRVEGLLLLPRMIVGNKSIVHARRKRIDGSFTIYAVYGVYGLSYGSASSTYTSYVYRPKDILAIALYTYSSTYYCPPENWALSFSPCLYYYSPCLRLSLRGVITSTLPRLLPHDCLRLTILLENLPLGTFLLHPYPLPLVLLEEQHFFASSLLR